MKLMSSGSYKLFYIVVLFTLLFLISSSSAGGGRNLLQTSPSMQLTDYDYESLPPPPPPQANKWGGCWACFGGNESVPQSEHLVTESSVFRMTKTIEAQDKKVKRAP